MNERLEQIKRAIVNRNTNKGMPRISLIIAAIVAVILIAAYIITKLALMFYILGAFILAYIVFMSIMVFIRYKQVEAMSRVDWNNLVVHMGNISSKESGRNMTIKLQNGTTVTNKADNTSYSRCQVGDKVSFFVTPAKNGSDLMYVFTETELSEATQPQ